MAEWIPAVRTGVPAFLVEGQVAGLKSYGTSIMVRGKKVKVMVYSLDLSTSAGTMITAYCANGDYLPLEYWVAVDLMPPIARRSSPQTFPVFPDGVRAETMRLVTSSARVLGSMSPFPPVEPRP